MSTREEIAMWTNLTEARVRVSTLIRMALFWDILFRQRKHSGNSVAHQWMLHFSVAIFVLCLFFVLHIRLNEAKETVWLEIDRPTDGKFKSDALLFPQFRYVFFFVQCSSDLRFSTIDSISFTLLCILKILNQVLIRLGIFISLWFFTCWIGRLLSRSGFPSCSSKWDKLSKAFGIKLT